MMAAGTLFPLSDFVFPSAAASRGAVSTAGILLFLLLLSLLAVQLLQSRKAETGDAPESWTVVSNGRHNAFTDLAFWKGRFWLAYIEAPTHFASRRSRVILLSSTDCRSWTRSAVFGGNGLDIRDPKLGIHNARLLLVALLNHSFDPSPFRTVMASSSDGRHWSELQDILPEGWLMGKPLSAGSTCHAPAHNLQLGAVALWQSIDGEQWHQSAMIAEGRQADETAIVLDENNLMTAVTRVEGRGSSLFGHNAAGTLVSVSHAPFTTWEQKLFDTNDRLDSPALLQTLQRLFIAGRRQAVVNTRLQKPGSVISRKRTALFELRSGLHHLVDLPSSGDTAYPGMVFHDGKLYLSYYTNSPQRDYPWLLGLLLPTSIRIACINPASLPVPGLPTAEGMK